jgi:type IV pilus assembly protein PilA
MRARMAANESSAIAVVRTLVVAEVGYSSMHPEAGYTCTLSDLTGAGLIDAKLASGQKAGYTFELSGCTASAESVANVKYRVVAFPMTRNQTGKRAFCSDESGFVKADENGSPQDCLENGSTLQ